MFWRFYLINVVFIQVLGILRKFVNIYNIKVWSWELHLNIKNEWSNDYKNTPKVNYKGSLQIKIDNLLKMWSVASNLRGRQKLQKYSKRKLSATLKKKRSFSSKIDKFIRHCRSKCWKITHWLLKLFLSGQRSESTFGMIWLVNSGSIAFSIIHFLLFSYTSN